MAISLLFALTSCNNENNEPKNYWQSSDLKKLQLKGKVRTISSEAYYGIYEFDNKGRIIKFEETDFDNENSKSLTDEKKRTGSIFAPAINNRSRAANNLPDSRKTRRVYMETYRYNSAGQLISVTLTNGTSEYHVNYKYGKHGAYVPFENVSYLLGNSYDFKKDLATICYTDSEYPNESYTDSVSVSGNKMTIYKYNVECDYSGECEIYKDTIDITLNSAKFPNKIEYDEYDIVELSYYDNNMLKEIKRSYGTRSGDDRPRRFDDDKPKRSYGARSGDDRPRRFDDDTPKRAYGARRDRKSVV